MVMNVRSRKPKIEQIVITDENLKLIHDCLEGRGAAVGQVRKQNIIKTVVGGQCIVCHGIPQKKLIYPVLGVKLVEYYCNNCFKLR